MAPNKLNQTLKPLPNEIRSIVRSGITINTVGQCVEELVYNSVDAGAKNIRIGVNLEQFNVRVDDDGSGLSEIDLEAAGVRYNTSKCSSLSDLNNLSSYGFRGEALASIVEVSNTVDIVTRPKAMSGVEFKKKFENGTVKGFVEKYNTSNKKSGTSVMVGKLLSKLPVRQKRIDKSIQLEEVKNAVENIALINPSLSIEIRNEKNGTVLFTFKPSSSYEEAVNQIFKSRMGFEVKFVQEHFLHGKFLFNLSICNDFVKRKQYQFVFLNNRFIRRCKIHKWVGNFILDRPKDSTNQKSDTFPIFMLNITCSFSEYDITLEPKKQVVEFRDWDAVYSGLEGLMLKLSHKNSLSFMDKKSDSEEKNNASLINSYDVKGALHSRFAARMQSPSTDSDRGSIGREKKSNTKTTTRERNIIRTGHSTHVVNVRELRKKRKLDNVAAGKPAPVPFKPKPDPSLNKPRLTLETFKKFPEWTGEFERTAPPPPEKKPKHSHNQENYKYYVPVPEVPPVELKKTQAAQLQEHQHQPNESNNFLWKMNRYLESYQEGANVTADRIMSGTDDEHFPNIESSSPSPPPCRIESPSSLQSIPPCHPKEIMTSYADVEKYSFHKSEAVVKNHFQDKWTFKNVKDDILKRLFKYYKANAKKTIKSSNGSKQKSLSNTRISNNQPEMINRPLNRNENTDNFQVVSNKLPAAFEMKRPDCVTDILKFPLYHPPQMSSNASSSEAPKLVLGNTHRDKESYFGINSSKYFENCQQNSNQASSLLIAKPTVSRESVLPPPPQIFKQIQILDSGLSKFNNPQSNQSNAIPLITNLNPFQMESKIPPDSRKIATTTENVMSDPASRMLKHLDPQASNSTLNSKRDQTSATAISDYSGHSGPFQVASKQVTNFFSGRIPNDGSENGSPVSQMFSFLKPPVLTFNQETTIQKASSTDIPQLLNLFPVQKSFSSEWNDQMMSMDYTEMDNNLFPSEWGAEIVIDRQGQEWLKTMDNYGKDIYINLNSGMSSSDIAHVHGNVRTITAGEMKNSNPARYNWLRKHFPRGFKQFWNGDSREVVKEGDLTKLSSSLIGNSLLKCINQQNPIDPLSKWTDAELQNVSKYFSSSKESTIQTVNNVNDTGIQCWKNLGGVTSSIKLNREDFELIRVIGQYDRKFILATVRRSPMESETLVVFDQHAVHERIRLEKLTSESFKISKSSLKYLIGSDVIPPYQLPLSETEVRIMQNYVECFRQAALIFETVSSTVVKVKMIPKCFFEKCSNEPLASREATFRTLVHGLIQELIHTIMETKISNLSRLPKTVHSVLCSQACHGAIKFGDVLDLETCNRLISNLRTCKQLFQCAHGRPSVVPLMKGQDMLKVSSAECAWFHNRQSCPGIKSLQAQESSKYFPTSDNETSNYFSLLDTSAIISKNNPVEDNPVYLKRFHESNKNENTSKTSDFFSFVSGERTLNKDDDEKSQYFFRTP